MLTQEPTATSLSKSLEIDKKAQKKVEKTEQLLQKAIATYVYTTLQDLYSNQIYKRRVIELQSYKVVELYYRRRYFKHEVYTK